VQKARLGSEMFGRTTAATLHCSTSASTSDYANLSSLACPSLCLRDPAAAAYPRRAANTKIDVFIFNSY